jgi:translocation and assembly module TamA
MLLLCVACAHEPANGRQQVRQLTLAGNRSFSTREIESGLATEESSRFAAHWLDPAALDIDLERIPAFYAARGWFEARVVAHDVHDRGDGSVDITIQIEEGQPARIDAITVEGADTALLRGLALERGHIFAYDDYTAAKDELLQKLRDQGYAYAKVSGDVEVDPDTHRVAVRLSADAGPLVSFGVAHVRGNGNLPARAIEHRATWDPGERYHPYDLQTTQARLYELGVFSSVQLEIPSDPSSPADVTMNVVPGALNELRLGGGIGIEAQREEARLRIEYARRNFLGGLRTLRLRLRPAYVVMPSIFDDQIDGFAAETDLTLTQPDFLGTRIATHGLVGYDRVLQQAYSYSGPRVAVGADRSFLHEHLFGGAAWNLQYLFFDSNTTLGLPNQYRLAWLEEFVQLDFRDRLIDPRAGANLTVRLEEGTPAAGSDYTYFKVTPEVRGYVPVGRRVVLAARGVLGLLEPGQSTSPVTRGYALGGPSSHRGFGFGRLAPRLNDMHGVPVPVPGDAEMLLSGEARFDLVRVGDRFLGLVAFTDLGDVTAQPSQLDPSNLHVAVGGSLEYDTPLGHIRAGAGVRVNRTGPGDPDPNDPWAFHFSIGEAF